MSRSRASVKRPRPGTHALPAASALPLTITLEPRWLVVRFANEQATASWAFSGGGLRPARAVAFHRVSDDELAPPVDARALFRARLASQGLADAIGLMTSRDLASYADVELSSESFAARCLATVGLGNALRAGDPPGPTARIGTINLLCCVSAALTDEALLEALGLAAEARTLAVREANVVSTRSGRPASGTGTDCIVIAAPRTCSGSRYAGKHTALGHVIGGAVAAAVERGIARWQQDRSAASR